MIRRILVIDPKKRFTISQIRRHRWMKLKDKQPQSQEQQSDAATAPVTPSPLTTTQTTTTQPDQQQQKVFNKRTPTHYATPVYPQSQKLTRAQSSGDQSDRRVFTLPSICGPIIKRGLFLHAVNWDISSVYVCLVVNEELNFSIFCFGDEEKLGCGIFKRSISIAHP